MPKNETEEIDGKYLERLTAMIRSNLSPELVADVTVSPPQPEFWHNMYTVRIRILLLGILETVEEVPITWWQAVRQRWAPRWWLRRHPLLMREIKVYGALYMRPSDDPFWETRYSSRVIS